MVKTYDNSRRYCVSYEWTNEEGETELIPFAANGNLFPLFKSFTGKELGDALNEYSKASVALNSSPAGKAFLEYYGLRGKPDEQKLYGMKHLQELNDYVDKSKEICILTSGMNLLEVLPMVMHACVYSGEEARELLAAGYDSLPGEVYEDTAFCMDLFNLIYGFQDYSKKKSHYPIGAGIKR